MGKKNFKGELVLTKTEDGWKKNWSSEEIRDENAYGDSIRDKGAKGVKVVKRKK